LSVICFENIQKVLTLLTLSAAAQPVVKRNAPPLGSSRVATITRPLAAEVQG